MLVLSVLFSILLHFGKKRKVCSSGLLIFEVANSKGVTTLDVAIRCSYSMHEVDMKHAKTNELINEHTKIEDYLHVNHGGELQVWTKHLIWYEEPPPRRRRLHVQPLTQRPSTPSFDDPQPTVIALDKWTSTLRPPNSPSHGIADVEPQEHGIF